ncbi:MAG: discoidin domain-containing protein, partial [Salinibacter sp.]
APRFGPGQVLDDDLSTYWAPGDSTGAAALTLTLDSARTVDVIELQEPIRLGQRVAAYRVEVPADPGGWRTLHEGTTIGHKWLVRLETPVTTSRVRVLITDARAAPLLAEVALYRTPPEE